MVDNYRPVDRRTANATRRTDLRNRLATYVGFDRRSDETFIVRAVVQLVQLLGGRLLAGKHRLGPQGNDRHGHLAGLIPGHDAHSLVFVGVHDEAFGRGK